MFVQQSFRFIYLLLDLGYLNLSAAYLSSSQAPSDLLVAAAAAVPTAVVGVVIFVVAAAAIAVAVLRPCFISLFASYQE